MPVQLTILPSTDEQLQELANVVLERFADNPEGAVDYINGVIDRQISKASGLLSYNSILFAGLQVSPGAGYPKIAGLWLALISCTSLLALLFVEWRKSASYGCPRIDFLHIAKLATRRTKLLTFSLVISIFSTLSAMLSLALTPPA